MATKHVAKSGSNANNGNSLGTAYLTIIYACSQISSGDTIQVHGTAPDVRTDYDEALQDVVPSGINASTPTQIIGFSGDNVWLTPTYGNYAFETNYNAYISFTRINVDATGNVLGMVGRIEGWAGGNGHDITWIDSEWIQGSDGIPDQGTDGGPFGMLITAGVSGIIGNNRFTNITTHGGGDTGDYSYSFYIQSDNNIIENCHIYNNQGAGIQIYNGHGFTPTGNIIRNNFIYDQTRSPNTVIWGIVIGGGYGAADTQIYNNVFYNILGSGGGTGSIYLYTGCTDTLIYNNSVTYTQEYGIHIESDATGTKLWNNISYDNGVDLLNAAGGATEQFNNTIGTNPLWVAAPENLQLQAGSPAIDTGRTVTIANGAVINVTTDILGFARPQGSAYCRGAYEFVSTTTGWSFIEEVTAGGDPSFEFAQSTSIDTTGANVLFISLSRYVGVSSSVVVSDNKSNMWIPLTLQTSVGSFSNQIYYALSPIVGSGHTFRAESTGNEIFPSFVVSAWHGDGQIGFGGQNGAVSSGTSTIQPGSVTPAYDDSLIITGLGNFGSDGPVSINLGFSETTIAAAPDYGGSSLGFLVLATAAAKNPTWNVTTADGYGFSSTIAWFRINTTVTPSILSHFRRRR